MFNLLYVIVPAAIIAVYSALYAFKGKIYDHE